MEQTSRFDRVLTHLRGFFGNVPINEGGLTRARWCIDFAHPIDHISNLRNRQKRCAARMFNRLCSHLNEYRSKSISASSFDRDPCRTRDTRDRNHRMRLPNFPAAGGRKDALSLNSTAAPSTHDLPDNLNSPVQYYRTSVA